MTKIETTPLTFAAAKMLRSLTSLDLTPKPRRILLAVKDEGMRRVLGSPLRAEGYEIVEAEDEAELLGSLALSMMQGRWHEPAHAIVCDAREDTSIIEALEKLRRAGYDLPVVVIAAQGDKETARIAKRLGAAAIFSTPFHVVDLRKALSAAMDEAPTGKLKAIR